MQNKGRLFKLIALAVFTAATTMACTGTMQTTDTTSAQVIANDRAPKLVVLLVVDGLPQRQITQYRDQLSPDGFARFLDRGTWFSNAHHEHAFTVTGAGHATLLTGAYPERTGIIGNDWLDANTGQAVYCTSDTSATYIGNPTKPLDGTSPKNLDAQSLGDVLRLATPKSKVLAVSGKDRGSILPAGKAGTAYMYMTGSGQFASSTFYMPAHPDWVNRFNAQKLADAYFKTQWKPLLEDAAYARSLPDKQAWFDDGVAGLPITFGKPNDAAPNAAFYAGLVRGPFVDEMTMGFARAAIAGEQLGQGAATDLLSISLSGHDYVNHGFSAESRLSHDHFLRLDLMLQDFFRHLDATIGKDNYVAVLTADHGFMPAPEYTKSLGQDAGRIGRSKLLATINSGLEKRFGEAKLVLGFSGSSLLMDKKLIAAKNIDFNAVTLEAKGLLVSQPGIAVAYTRNELLAGDKGQPLFASLKKSWSPSVSGDVQYAVKPNWMFSSATTGTTHGSPYAYDSNIPIMWYGPKWVKAGHQTKRIESVDIAPTLAKIIAIKAPEKSQGQVLTLR